MALKEVTQGAKIPCFFYHFRSKRLDQHAIFGFPLPMGGIEFPNPVLRALLFALLCFLGPFMETFRCCSRTTDCGTALTATSDVSVTDCGHDYCTGCLLKLQETTPYCRRATYSAISAGT